MAIPGIPNSYKGRNYRSLLETRWAIMFEKLGWQAEYEPFELNGWIPDFMLIGKDKSLLVEVKPFSHIEQYYDSTVKIEKATKDTEHKQTEVLLLGVNPAQECENWPFPRIGWISEVYELAEFPGKYIRSYGEARMWHSSKGLFCLGSVEGAYYDRINNSDWKDSGDYEVSLMAEMWADAGSQTQWKAPYTRSNNPFLDNRTPAEKMEGKNRILNEWRIQDELKSRN